MDFNVKKIYEKNTTKPRVLVQKAVVVTYICEIDL